MELCGGSEVPVVERGGRSVLLGGSLLTAGSGVEARPLLTGVEEGGHPMPSEVHKSPLVVEDGGVAAASACWRKLGRNPVAADRGRERGAVHAKEGT